jgi:hypothetical protein
MSYFDAIVSRSFKSGADGQMLFDAIPTGLLAGCGCFVFLRMLRARRASGVARPPTAA